MTAPQNVRIDLPPAARGYDIFVGEGLLAQAGGYVEKACGIRKCLIVTDDNVAPHYLKLVEGALEGAGHKLLPSIVIPHGEASKSFDSLRSLIDQIFDRHADRKTLIVALGGGVIGDLAGFAASILHRSVDFVQFPTTLLAQVDSSVGGKTGINTAYGKNTIGAFYQPLLVLADVSSLNTLPHRELQAGYAETVKYGLIMDRAFFDWCDDHAPALLKGDAETRIAAVRASCEYKAKVVMEDELEAGKRALLNLGHTFGHALESATGYGDALLHGEAVAIGTVLAFDLSVQMGLCPAEDAAAVRAHFEANAMSTRPPQQNYNVDELMALMGQDKKALDGALTLILARGIGECFVAKKVDPAPVRALWAKTIG